MSAGGRGSGAVPAARHWRERLPALAFRIVGLVLGERVGWKLAAQNQNQVAIKRVGETAARGRKRRTRGPGIRRGVVDVVHIGFLTGGLSEIRLRLDEIAKRRDAVPDRVIQNLPVYFRSRAYGNSFCHGPYFL